MGGFILALIQMSLQQQERSNSSRKSIHLENVGRNETRACFYYHLGQCIGCCDHEVSKEEYDAQIKKIQRFLNGDVKTIKDD